MCGTAFASECIGDGCDVDITPAPITETVTENVSVMAQYGDDPDTTIYVTGTPMATVKMLSVKPAPMDGRRPLWDGTDGDFAPRAYDKTVSGVDGAPLWDDSIVSYRDKDFSDWYLEPNPIVWKDTLDAAAIMNQDINIDEIYAQNMADAAQTRARVEELLAPKKPSSNLWLGENVLISDLSIPVIDTVIESDGCPFDTDVECEIWRKKPMVRETVSPRSAKIRSDKMMAFANVAQANPHICADHTAAAPLLARYKMLMRAANSCCVDGLVYKLKNAGASDGLVYKFLADDANFYGLGARCLMTTDAELDEKYPNTATAAAAADVRNGCLCRNKQWFTAMLAPFVDAWEMAPEFKNARFDYTYVDGLGREITTSVNTDVQNVLNQLAICP